MSQPERMVPAAPARRPPARRRLLWWGIGVLAFGLLNLRPPAWFEDRAFAIILSDPGGGMTDADREALRRTKLLAARALQAYPVLGAAVAGIGVVLLVVGIVAYGRARSAMAWVYQPPPGWPTQLPVVAGRAAEQASGAGPWPYPPKVPDPPAGWQFWRAERLSGRRGR